MAPASEAEVQRTFVGAAGMDSSITVDMVAGVLQVIPLSALCMFSRAGHVHPHPTMMAFVGRLLQTLLRVRKKCADYVLLSAPRSHILL